MAICERCNIYTYSLHRKDMCYDCWAKDKEQPCQQCAEKDKEIAEILKALDTTIEERDEAFDELDKRKQCKFLEKYKEIKRLEEIIYCHVDPEQCVEPMAEIVKEIASKHYNIEVK